jgi:hypothetical protein
MKRDLKRSVTKDLMNKDNDNWTPPWSSKITEKAKKGEYVDLIDLRHNYSTTKEHQAGTDLPGGELQLIVKGDRKNKKDLTSIVEWASLYHSYIDLLRSVVNRHLLHQAIKHGRFCHGLIQRDKYTWQSIIDYDASRRRAAGVGENWNYDAAVACSTLITYSKEGDKSTNRKRGRSSSLKVTTNANSKTRRVTNFKGRGTATRDRICFHWADGNCSRGDNCNFDHYCKTCGLGPKDKHTPGSCNKGAAQRSNGKGRPSTSNQ